jgi:methyl-accepting chemotaxis protein
MQMMAPPEDALTERFARLDERFDRTDERIADVDRRVAEAAKDTSRQFEEVNRRITEKSNETNLRLTRVEETNIELKRQVATFNTTFQRGNYALIATVIGAILAFLAKGG